MRPKDLLNGIKETPFKPFRIHLTDGTRLEVPQAGMVMVGKNTAVLPSSFTRDDEGVRVAEHWRTISLMHIVQFSELDEPIDGRGRKTK